MWLGARRAGTIANALGRNWMVTEQRKAGEGSVCGSPACQAGGRENELETLRNVSRPRTQRVGGIMPISRAHNYPEHGL